MLFRSSARYRITGSWDKPVITLVEKRELPLAPASPGSAPAPAPVPVPVPGQAPQPATTGSSSQ